MKDNKLRNFYKSLMLIILTAVITFIITSTVMYNKYGEGKITYVTTQSSTSSDLVSKTFQAFHKYISERYIYDIDDQKMLESAIKGYVKGLGDQYSEYITKDEMEEYMQETVGKYVGIGVYLVNDTETNQVMVLAPMKGSPAEEAGIKAGDYIKKVDGVEYTGEQLNQASSALKKEEGTKANVEILRNGDTLNIEVERRKIKLNPVESEDLEGNIGYISVTSFDEETKEDFENAYNELKAKNIKSLIIDLRNNGGGIVNEATDIADLMVEKGKTLLITTGKNEGEKVTKSKLDKIIDMPIVVLINSGTASSSEILAAALKENNDNVTIIGTQSYGKGVIQTIYTLSDGSGLKLTTNEYFTPNRNSINKKGIVPDIIIELPKNETENTNQEIEDLQLKKAVEVLKNK